MKDIPLQDGQQVFHCGVNGSRHFYGNGSTERSLDIC